MKRIALVGVTGYGGVHFRHLRALAEEGAADLAAAAVINPEHPDAAEPLAWLQARGAAVYPTAEALFAAEAGKIDLVCLPVGIAVHEPLVQAALAAGANVLVEKPAAGCLAAIDRMIAAERAAAPLRVFVGFQHVSAPEVGRIREILSSGALGKPRKVVVTGIWPRADAYYARNGWAARLAAPDGTPVRDSPANNAFAHYLNLALCFATTDPAMPAAPTGVGGALFRVRPEIETFDVCMLEFSTGGTARILLCLSHAAESSTAPRIRVECERGAVLWTHEGPWEVRDATGAVLDSGTAMPPHGKMFRAVLAAVSREERSSHAEFAEGRVPVLCSLPMARMQVHAVELIHRELGVSPVVRDRVCRDKGQWVVPGLPDVFENIWQTGELKLPDWK